MCACAVHALMYECYGTACVYVSNNILYSSFFTITGRTERATPWRDTASHGHAGEEAKRKLEETQAELKLEHRQEIEEITADHETEIDVSWVQ